MSCPALPASAPNNRRRVVGVVVSVIASGRTMSAGRQGRQRTCCCAVPPSVPAEFDRRVMVAKPLVVLFMPPAPT